MRVLLTKPRSPTPRRDGERVAAILHRHRHVPRSALRRSTTPQLSLSPEDEPNPEDASEYSVDWDTAWSKEISSREEGTQQWRPEGREAVTEQQLATARATKAMDDASFNMQMAATVRITARFLSLSLCFVRVPSFATRRTGGSGSPSSPSSRSGPR